MAKGKFYYQIDMRDTKSLKGLDGHEVVRSPHVIQRLDFLSEATFFGDFAFSGDAPSGVVNAIVARSISLRFAIEGARVDIAAIDGFVSASNPFAMFRSMFSRDDRIIGSPHADAIYGFSGDDRISGGLGDDLLVGGRGDDTLRGGHGEDTLVGGAGEDVFILGGDRYRADVVRGYDADADALHIKLGRRQSPEDVTIERFADRDEIWVDGRLKARVFGDGVDHDDLVFL